MPTYKADLSRLSQTQLAELTGCAKDTVSKRLRQAGVTPAAQDGRTLYYVPRLALPVIYEIGSGLSLEAERARLAKEQADHQELKNAELRGELLGRDEVETTWARMVLAAKERLRSIPATARVRIAGFTTKQVIALRDLIDEALCELADSGLPPEAAGRQTPGDAEMTEGNSAA